MEKKLVITPKIGEIFNQFLTSSLESDFFQKYGLLDIFFNFQIDEDTKGVQATNISKFAGYPRDFVISNLDEIVRKNLWTFKFLHIYFIYENGKISLLFIFNFNEKNKVPLQQGEQVYVLRNSMLEPVKDSDFEQYRKYILEYYVYFNQTFSKQEITTYITYSMERIYKNFSSLVGGELLIGGSSDDEVFYRPNIMLKIDKACCKTTLQYSPDDQNKVYFDIGNMHP